MTLSRLEQSERNDRPVRRQNGRDWGAPSEPSPMRHGGGMPPANEAKLRTLNFRLGMTLALGLVSGFRVRC